MARYIDADKLNGYEFGLISTKAQNLFHKTINNAQTEDVKPIVYATLLVDEDGNMKCSNCGNSECWGNYCMNCGATMNEKKKNKGMTREEAIRVLKAWDLNQCEEFSPSQFEKAFQMAISALEKQTNTTECEHCEYNYDCEHCFFGN